MEKHCTIQGIHCPSCVLLLTMNLEELEGVNTVTIEQSSGKTILDIDEKVTDMEQIAKIITSTGAYTLHL